MTHYAVWPIQTPPNSCGITPYRLFWDMQWTSRYIAENVEACFAEESYRDKEGYERLVAMHIQQRKQIVLVSALLVTR